jgi:hypothetical protein
MGRRLRLACCYLIVLYLLFASIQAAAAAGAAEPAGLDVHWNTPASKGMLGPVHHLHSTLGLQQIPRLHVNQPHAADRLLLHGWCCSAVVIVLLSTTCLAQANARQESTASSAASVLRDTFPRMGRTACAVQSPRPRMTAQTGAPAPLTAVRARTHRRLQQQNLHSPAASPQNHMQGAW